jgi:drug/metabolite transporter (DMT)-like permease
MVSYIQAILQERLDLDKLDKYCNINKLLFKILELMQQDQPSPHNVSTRPLLVVLLGILAVSTASIFIRQAQQEAPSLVIAAYRLGLAALVLAPFAYGKRKEILGFSKKQWLLALGAGGILALHFASWITSLEYTSIASSVVLVTTTPLWVALFSPLFLKERLGRMAMFGLAVALLGGTVVGMSQACSLSTTGLECSGFQGFWSGKAALGNFLALVGAWMAAGYMMIGRRLRPGLSLVSYVFVVYGVAGLVLLGLVGLAGLPLTGYAPMTTLWFIALAVIPQLVGHSSLNWALRYLPASFVSVSLLGEPIGSVILAFIFLSESPTALELAGGVLILFGIFLATRNKN